MSPLALGLLGDGDLPLSDLLQQVHQPAVPAHGTVPSLAPGPAVDAVLPRYLRLMRVRMRARGRSNPWRIPNKVPVDAPTPNT